MTPLVTNAINKSTTQKNAKTGSVVFFYKYDPNKNEISNFRPVSVLKIFSKVYERVIKE